MNYFNDQDRYGFNSNLPNLNLNVGLPQPKTFYEPPKIQLDPPKPVYREDPLRTPMQHAQQMPYMHMHPSLRPGM